MVRDRHAGRAGRDGRSAEESTDGPPTRREFLGGVGAADSDREVTDRDPVMPRGS